MLWLFTAVAVLLGVSQFRRQRMLARYEELKLQGIGMTDMPTQWRDLLWQRPPQQAFIRVDLHEKGAIHIEEQRFTMEAGRQRVVALQRTLTELGIPQTFILVLKRAENGEQYLQTSTTVDALQ